MDRMDRIKTKERDKGPTKGREKREKTSNGSESIHHRPHVTTPTTEIPEP